MSRDITALTGSSAVEVSCQHILYIQGKATDKTMV